MAITIDESELPTGFSKSVIRRFMNDDQFGKFVLKYEDNKLRKTGTNRFGYLRKEVEPAELQMLKDWFDESVSDNEEITNRYNRSTGESIKPEAVPYKVRSVALRFLYQSNPSLR